MRRKRLNEIYWRNKILFVWMSKKKNIFHLMAEMTSFMHACKPTPIDKGRKILDTHTHTQKLVYFRVEPVSPIWIASRWCKINDNCYWYWILNGMMTISNIHQMKIKTVMSVAFVTFEMVPDIFYDFQQHFQMSKINNWMLIYYLKNHSIWINVECFQLSSQWLFVHFPYISQS